MPKYFFNTVDGQRHPDEEGSDLPDLAAVKAKATLVMGELLKEQPDDLWSTGHLRLEITDQSGALILALETSLQERN